MRKQKTDVLNNRKPIHLSELVINEGDCFGNEYSTTNVTCIKCTYYDVCGIVMHSKRNPKVNEIRKLSGNFFDELDWDAVPWDDLLKVILEGEVTLEELREAVKESSKVVDTYTLNIKVQNWMITNNLKTSSDGYIITK